MLIAKYTLDTLVVIWQKILNFFKFLCNFFGLSNPNYETQNKVDESEKVAWQQRKNYLLFHAPISRSESLYKKHMAVMLKLHLMFTNRTLNMDRIISEKKDRIYDRIRAVNRAYA
jgi:hypothetical protein